MNKCADWRTPLYMTTVTSRYPVTTVHTHTFESTSDQKKNGSIKNRADALAISKIRRRQIPSSRRQQMHLVNNADVQAVMYCILSVCPLLTPGKSIDVHGLTCTVAPHPQSAADASAPAQRSAHLEHTQQPHPGQMPPLCHCSSLAESLHMSPELYVTNQAVYTPPCDFNTSSSQELSLSL